MDQQAGAGILKRGPQRVRLRGAVVADHDAVDDDIAVILTEVLKRPHILAGEQKRRHAPPGFIAAVDVTEARAPEAAGQQQFFIQADQGEQAHGI